MQNYVLRAIAGNKNIRAFAAITTGLVEEARKIHDTTPVATAALGRTLTAAAMMGLMLKGGKDKLSIQISGDGPLKQILAVADAKGNVKGYVVEPHVDLPLREDGKLDVGKAVGKNGKMIVIKDLGLKEPYIAQSRLVSGEIAEDLTAYFAYSEQQPSAVGLGVLVDRDYTVKAAGGFILQLMPEADDQTIEKLEKRLSEIPSITTIIQEEADGKRILENVLEGFDIEILEQAEVRFACDCSEERLESALISVGAEELKKMIEEDGHAELICHFCNTKYYFDKAHLERLYREAQQ